MFLTRTEIGEIFKQTKIAGHYGEDQFDSNDTCEDDEPLEDYDQMTKDGDIGPDRQRSTD